MRWGLAAAVAAAIAPVGGCQSTTPICLSDSFDEGVIDPLRWTRLGEAPLAVVDGKLRLTAPLGLDVAQSGIASAERVDLRDRSVEVRIATPLPADAQTRAELAIVPADTNQRVAIQQSNGTLVLSSIGTTVDNTTIPADPDIDAWRIFSDAGNIVFETRATDGTTMQNMTPEPFALDSVQIRLTVEVFGVPVTAGSASFDDLVVDQGACTNADRYRDHPEPYDP